MIGLVWVASAALFGCATGDGATTGSTPAFDAAASTSVAESATTSATTAAPTTAMPTTVTPTTATPTTATTDTRSSTTTETIATVPEQPVPGIDSEDPFCRAWSEFAGSFQALTFASISGADPLVGARLEVAAAGAVVAAALTLDDTFPGAIADEREVFVDELIGPFARRAARAADELRSLDVGDDDIELLGDAWLEALVEWDAVDPVIAVAVPAELGAAVDSAAATFGANVPPIADDPSLVTRAEAPGTLAYLADQCPDQGVLGGNDAIG